LTFILFYFSLFFIFIFYFFYFYFFTDGRILVGENPR